MSSVTSLAEPISALDPLAAAKLRRPGQDSPADSEGRVTVLRLDRSGLPAVVLPGEYLRIERFADPARPPLPRVWVDSVVVSGRAAAVSPSGRRALAGVLARVVVGDEPRSSDFLEPCGPGAWIAWVGAGRGVLVHDEDVSVEVVNEGDVSVVVDLAVAVGRSTVDAAPLEIPLQGLCR